MESRDHAPDPRRWQALALVCVAMFMTVLDVSIVNVALPSIKTALNVAEKEIGRASCRERVCLGV